MITCVDTNVISALLRDEPGAVLLGGQLIQAAAQGSLCVHASVYAELLAAPDMRAEHLEAFLKSVPIEVDWNTSVSMWTAASSAYRAYSRRRRESGGGLPRRLLIDFLIGAHAQQLGAVLFTLDPQHYRQGFPKLLLL
ncbi:type II toxin-antitoxin system VapC family toxin [Deinococcus sp. Leaf326]|jgi:predicted nucleic acid-binding protein|uniref:type II toxin-antitoxin system VapC family toxin n=1 Tax=Deinococcus sp. Leaf326 TaxID=1736338 RepID=UPI0006FAB39D|nr:PIN domain-containing protein [Deinococcus sp. Leaf326]KQR25701.1 hypothetical protein ASF71_18620 [Deinococcus sp. Leaf326]